MPDNKTTDDEVKRAKEEMQPYMDKYMDALTKQAKEKIDKIRSEPGFPLDVTIYSAVNKLKNIIKQIKKQMKNLILILAALLMTALLGCGEDNPVTTDAQLVGDLDSIYVQNINDSGDTARAEIHLNRLVKSVKVTFDLQTNANNNNMPAILIKFGVAQQTIITLSPSNALILNNSMLDSDVFFTVSVKSLNNVFVFLKLKNIKVYLN